MPAETRRIVIVGDAHGHLERLCRVLREAGLLSAVGQWSGGNATLWFLGDFCDRGPDGIGVVDLVMRLQGEAAEAGGHVAALLGNHELLILGVRKFGDTTANDYEGYSFRDVWLLNGGREHDLHGLTGKHAEWLRDLPAMALEGDSLLMHPDSLMYKRMGKTIAAVNRAVRAVLDSSDITAWDRCLRESMQRRAFDDSQSFGAALARNMLRRFGGRQIVHGHTPISYMTGKPAEEVTAPYVYAENRCVNVDAGLYLGSPGFVLDLGATERPGPIEGAAPQDTGYAKPMDSRFS